MNDVGYDTGMFSDADGDLYFKMNGVRKIPVWNDRVYNMNEIQDANTQAVDAGTITRKVFLTKSKNSQGYISRAAIGLSNNANCFSPVLISAGVSDDGLSFVDWVFDPSNGRITSPIGQHTVFSDLKWSNILEKPGLTIGNNQISHGAQADVWSGDTYLNWVNNSHAGYSERGTWDYANNAQIDTGFGKIHLAGTAAYTWGNGVNGTALFITPGNANLPNSLVNEMIFYSQNGPGYSSEWTRVLTHKNFHYYVVPKTGGTFIGYVDFTAGAGNSGSDMRFKTNVKKFSDVLERIKQLDIIDYSWNKKGEERDTFGLNAGQIKMLFPKIYHQRDDEDKTEWLEYDRTGVIALKGIQELQDKCDKYEKAFKLISEKLGLSLEDLGL